MGHKSLREKIKNHTIAIAIGASTLAALLAGGNHNTEKALPKEQVLETQRQNKDGKLLDDGVYQYYLEEPQNQDGVVLKRGTTKIVEPYKILPNGREFESGYICHPDGTTQIIPANLDWDLIEYGREPQDSHHTTLETLDQRLSSVRGQTVSVIEYNGPRKFKCVFNQYSQK